MTDYCFDVDLAREYSIEEAIVLRHIMFWIKKNMVCGKHFIDGKYWTFTSTKMLQDFFPFWSEDQIKRVFKKLVDHKLIVKGCYNTNPFDRTNWYALVDESIVQNHPISTCEIAQSDCAKSLNVNTDNNTDNKPYNNSRFDEFWNLYPRKVAKAKAMSLYSSILKSSKASEDEIISGLQGYVDEIRANNTAEKYIAHPTTWLNQERWQDYKKQDASKKINPREWFTGNETRG